MNAPFDLNLWLVLAHTVVWESQNAERDRGLPPGWARNDFSPDPPPPRDYAAETRDTLQAQVDLAPQKFAAEAEFRPKYAALDLGIARDSLPGLLDLAETAAPRLGAMERESKRLQTAADVGLLNEFGPQYREALMRANPEQAALRNRLVTDATRRLDEPGLTPFESRRFQQNYRSANRGRFGNTGQTGAAQEAFYLMDRERELADQNRLNAYRAIGLDQQLYGDTFLQTLGRNSGVNPQGYVAQAGSFTPGNLFNPESGYASDVYNTNYNGAAAANIAGASNMAGLAGAGIGLAGKLAAAPMTGGTSLFGKMFGG